MELILLCYKIISLSQLFLNKHHRFTVAAIERYYGLCQDPMGNEIFRYKLTKYFDKIINCLSCYTKNVFLVICTLPEVLQKYFDCYISNFGNEFGTPNISNPIYGAIEL